MIAMSKDIWHKLPEQPEKGRDVLEKWHHLGITHYTHFVAKNGIAEDNPFTDAWCYLDDLLACEQELIRTRKVLDKGMKHITGLNNMIESWYKLLQSDISDSTKCMILKSAISAYVETKGGDNSVVYYGEKSHLWIYTVYWKKKTPVKRVKRNS